MASLVYEREIGQGDSRVDPQTTSTMLWWNSCVCRLIDNKKLANERARISAVIVKIRIQSKNNRPQYEALGNNHSVLVCVFYVFVFFVRFIVYSL